MRKLVTLGLVLVLAAAFALPLVSRAQAQGGELELDVWVDGEITNEQVQQQYTFTGTAGQMVAVEMQAAEDSDLDTYLVLQDSAGNVLAENDDASGFDSAIVYRVPEDGELVVVATRYDQEAGDSVGAYQLRVQEVPVLEVGSSVDMTISVVEGSSEPFFYALTPADSGTVAVSFTQPGGELFLGLEVTRVSDEMSILTVDGTRGVRSGTLNVDLDGGEVYLLTVRQAWFSFVWEDSSIDVNVSVAAAE